MSPAPTRVTHLVRHLTGLCRDLSQGRYGNADDLFELTKTTGDYPKEITELAEAFGLMLVKSEAREMYLKNTIVDLERTRAELTAARESLARENAGLRRTLDRQYSPKGILGQSLAMRRVLTQVEKLADAPVNVLIFGETGTGKELVARALHYNSPRSRGPFIAVNCAAIPETLFESELFGIEKGVATGVSRRTGRIAQAHGGTLFLDEVGDMPLVGQAKILRVLEDREVMPVGGARGFPVDVRVVAATNVDLKAAVDEKRFRQDLYFRLKVAALHLPPLRERPDDVEILARNFLNIHARRMGRKPLEVSPEAMACLKAHSWPGNVRELENAIERAMVVGTGELIEPEDLPFGKPTATVAPGGDSLAEMERAHIHRILERSDWNISQAARVLQIDRVTLYNKIKKYSLRG